MIAYANIKFNFDFTSNIEEIQDIIQTGEYFPEQVLECEVTFCE